MPALLLPLLYLAAALQSLLSPRWQIAGVLPDLLALAAFTWLAVSQNRYAFLVTALVGLIADLNSPAPLGLSFATFALVGYLLTRLRSRIHLDHLSGQLAIIWLGVTSACLMQNIALRALGYSAVPWLLLAPRSVLIGLYTAGLSTPLLMLAGWLHSPRAKIELTSN